MYFKTISALTLAAGLAVLAFPVAAQDATMDRGEGISTPSGATSGGTAAGTPSPGDSGGGISVMNAPGQGPSSLTAQSGTEPGGELGTGAATQVTEPEFGLPYPTEPATGRSNEPSGAWGLLGLLGLAGLAGLARRPERREEGARSRDRGVA